MNLDIPLLNVPPAELDHDQIHVPQVNTSGPLYFDLETVPDESRKHLFGLPLIRDIPPETSLDALLSAEEFVSASIADMSKLLAGKNPPDCWIDEVIEAERNTGKKFRKGVMDVLDAVRSAKTSSVHAAASQCKTMSVTPEFCRIAAVGIAVGDGPVTAILCQTEIEERAALCHWWDCVANVRGPMVGYNILGFDIPVILTRSAILGITPKRFIGNIRPWDKDACDLMERRFKTRGSAKLKDLARYLGLQVDAEGVDGSHVAELMKSDPAMVAKYVKSDVELTRRLYKFWAGYFC